MGGWSQARYQRHAKNFHLHHMKEVVEVLDKMVRDEKLERIVVGCDQTAKPRFMELLPKHLAETIVDVMPLEMKTPDHEVLAETLDALRQHDAATDLEHVEQMLGAWRAGGLAVVGPEATLKALSMGQVEELLISDVDPETMKPSGELVAGAHKNGARVRIIEDGALLSEVGGVGALLRFKI